MTRSESPGLLVRLRRRLRRKRSEEVTRRLDRQHQRIAELEREVARVSPQVAGLEERLSALADRAALAGPSLEPAAEAEISDQAALLQEIRAEHARVRARITAATRYEERLARLEDQVAEIQGRP